MKNPAAKPPDPPHGASHLCPAPHLPPAPLHRGVDKPRPRRSCFLCLHFPVSRREGGGRRTAGDCCVDRVAPLIPKTDRAGLHHRDSAAWVNRNVRCGSRILASKQPACFPHWQTSGAQKESKGGGALVSEGTKQQRNSQQRQTAFPSSDPPALSPPRTQAAPMKQARCRRPLCRRRIR